MTVDWGLIVTWVLAVGCILATILTFKAIFKDVTIYGERRRSGDGKDKTS